VNTYRRRSHTSTSPYPGTLIWPWHGARSGLLGRIRRTLAALDAEQDRRAYARLEEFLNTLSQADHEPTSPLVPPDKPPEDRR
jgi:hypothetical protein